MKLRVVMIFFVLVIGVNTVFAAPKQYMVNSFYAIQSAGEYDRVKDIIDGNANHIYFQWARIARNDNDQMVLTGKYDSPISKYDNSTKYGFPGADKLSDYKKRYPKGKVFLSVFFEAVRYSDGRNSAIDFLNMGNSEWEQCIINPLIDMLEEHGFSGVVLDFEGFTNSYGTEYYSEEKRTSLKDKYSSFLSCLKASLGERELAVCIHPTNVIGYYNGYDLRFISELSDYVILMAYNYQHVSVYGQRDDVPQELIERIRIRKIHEYNTQPYYRVKEAIEQVINQHGVDANKLVLGLDLCGMGWVKLKKNINGVDYEYYELRRSYLDGIEALPAEEEYLEEHRVCRKVVYDHNIPQIARNEHEKDGAQIQQIEYYYESPKSLKDKYDYLTRQYKLAGVSVWRLGVGSLSIWEALFKIPQNSLPEQLPVISFKDVRPEDWFYSNISLLASKGIVKGNPDGTFAPQDNVQVDAFIKMIVVSLGYSSIENTPGYWAQGFIDKAMELGIVKDGEFSVYTRTINRGEMARIIARALNEDFQTDIEIYSKYIKDYGKLKEDIREYVLQAYSKGIITGNPDGEFKPDKNATRAEAAAMITRLIEPELRKVPVLNQSSSEVP